VILFAKALLLSKVSRLRVHPAWLVNKDHQNPYNIETKRLLQPFNELGIDTSSGNDISPAGNALTFLGEYFSPPKDINLSVPCGQMPYTNRLDEIDSISVSPNGDLMLCHFPVGNVYEKNVLAILDKYDPYTIPTARALLDGGVGNLLAYAENLGVTVDTSDCYSACNVCMKIMKVLSENDA